MTLNIFVKDNLKLNLLFPNQDNPSRKYVLYKQKTFRKLGNSITTKNMIDFYKIKC
jgi:hypothetical protein